MSETETGGRSMAGFGSALEDWLARRPPDTMSQVHRWALLPPGKLLRPLLVLESAGSVHGDPSRIVDAAVALEMMHVGSLVHDDIIDDDAIRRGRTAAHVRFGTARALVAADALFFAVFDRLLACRGPDIGDERITEAVAILSSAGLDITRGATVELDRSGTDMHGDVDAYLEMVRLKTASLLRAAGRIGALLVGGSAAHIRALGTFGEALGVAFQIVNDLLPYLRAEQPATGTPQKPVASDLRNQRPTLPLLLATRDGTAAQRAELRLLLHGDDDAMVRQERLHRIVMDTGAPRSARELLETQLSRCRAALAELPSTSHRETLAGLGDELAETASGRRWA